MAAKFERDFEGFKKYFRDLRLHADVGVRLYQAKRKKFDSKFYAVYEELSTLATPLEQHQLTLCEAAPNYDFVNKDGTHVKGNGYRSLLHILKSILDQLVTHLQKSARERGSLLYAALEDLSTLTADTRTLQGVEVMLRYAVELMRASKPPTLINDGEMAETLKRMACTEDIARDAMYGRCLGFQYNPSLKPILQTLAIFMASYEQWYIADKGDPIKQLVKSLWKGSKYVHQPSQRGIKIADLTQDCSLSFTKAFWSMMEHEAFKAAMNMVSKSVEVSRSLEVPSKNIVIKNTSGEDVTLTPPFSDIGYRPIPATLISHQWRKNQPISAYGRKRTPMDPSPYLIFHVHGGGFVAQSSRAHEFYLRWWSCELQAPIFSIDYTLSPEAPYPRAVDECVMAYAWALQNLDTLGSTGEKILLCGDSAGGNLVIAMAMKLKQLGIKLPHGIFSFYPTTIVRSSVTPSRFLSLLDPLLPIGVLYSCLDAYTGNIPSDEVLQMRREYRQKILKSQGFIVHTPNDTSGEFSPSLQNRRERSNTAPSRTPPPRPKPPRPKAPMRGKTMDSMHAVEDESGSTQNETSSMTEVDLASPRPPRPPPPKVKTAKKTDEDEKESKSHQTDTTDTTLTEVDLAGMAEPSEQLLDLSSEQSLEQPSDQPSEQPNGSDEKKVPPNDIGVDESEMMSVAPFMGTGRTGSIRLGRRQPDKEEILSEQKIQEMVDEIVLSFKDPEITKDPFISPALAADEFLKGLPFVHILVCGLDPLLDDGVVMAQRLQALGQPVQLTVMDKLPHGFLCLTGVDEIQSAQKTAIRHMKDVLAN